MSTTTDTARPVYLPGRSRQGIVLGLDAWQVVTLLIGGGLMLAFTSPLGPSGLLLGAPLYLPFGIIAFLRRHGMSMPRWIVVRTMKRVRTKAGATSQTFRPEQVRRAGTLNLPGKLATVQIWDVDGLGTMYDASGRTVTITAELEVPGFLMKDFHERYDLAERWSAVLASFTKRPGIKRVALQERTTPITIRAARETFERVTAEGQSVPQAEENYRAVMDRSEGYTVAHRNYLTLTLDLLALSAQIKALGGNKEAIQTLAAVEAGNVTDALKNAEVVVRRWLSPRDLAALARAAFDPEFVAYIENRSDEHRGVDLSGIGPMYLEEPKDDDSVVRTDSGVHTTMWIHEWPRSAAPIGFVNDLVFARHPVTGQAVSHILTIVLTPVQVGKALRRIEKEKKTWRANERMRAQRGSDGSAIDAADYQALQRQEEELLTGHGEFTYGAYLTVSAREKEELEQALAGATNAMSRVGMEGQILYCQQAEALMVSALPIGQGLR